MKQTPYRNGSGSKEMYFSMAFESPEDLFNAYQAGHISKRSMKRMMNKMLKKFKRKDINI